MHCKKFPGKEVKWLILPFVDVVVGVVNVDVTLVLVEVEKNVDSLEVTIVIVDVIVENILVLGVNVNSLVSVVILEYTFDINVVMDDDVDNFEVAFDEVVLNTIVDEASVVE